MQSSAVDFLHALLVTFKWLCKVYNVNSARLIMTFHDEMRILVKTPDANNAVLCLQLSNLYTRCLFSHKIGLDDLPQVILMRYLKFRYYRNGRILNWKQQNKIKSESIRYII